MGEGHCGCKEKPVRKAVAILGTAQVCRRCGVPPPCAEPSGPRCQGMWFLESWTWKKVIKLFNCRQMSFSKGFLFKKALI